MTSALSVCPKQMPAMPIIHEKRACVHGGSGRVQPLLSRCGAANNASLRDRRVSSDRGSPHTELWGWRGTPVQPHLSRCGAANNASLRVRRVSSDRGSSMWTHTTAPAERPRRASCFAAPCGTRTRVSTATQAGGLLAVQVSDTTSSMVSRQAQLRQQATGSRPVLR